MPVVSNSSPLINLAIINRLDLLKSQFAQVVIPPDVYLELRIESDLPGTSALRDAFREGWIVQVELSDLNLSNALALDLDRGEATAIALALQLGQKQILMDERDGRVKAKALGLEPIGVLGVLLRGKRDGAVASIREAMQALKRDAGFFLADELVDQILAEAGE